jgi:hypothetical protein
MKKLMFTMGVVSFLWIGSLTIESVVAGRLYDDPPKKEVKSKKSCCSPSDMKHCSGTCTDTKKASKMDSKDKEAMKEKSTSTTTTDTKKDNPDKK